MYSQRKEDDIIVPYLSGQVGTLLDVGAHDGRLFSNSLRLIELGWSGVLVEPSPKPFNELLNRHGGNEKLQLVNVAVLPKSEITEFYDSGGDALSTVDTEHKMVWESQAKIKFRKYWLKPVTVGELLQKFGKTFTYLTLDVEGANIQVLLEFPLEEMTQLKLICVEHESKQSLILERVTKLGFKKLADTCENLVLGR